MDNAFNPHGFVQLTKNPKLLDCGAADIAEWTMQRIGNAPLLKRLAKEAKAGIVTPTQQKLIEAAAVIRFNPEETEAAFMARHLVQCTLPHSNPGKIEAWVRRNGNLALVIQPGWDTEVSGSVGYPYGVIPRLLLFWLTTEAVRTRKRRIELGTSLSGFMRELGLVPSSAGAGKRSDATRLRDQMRRLFRCRITFDYVVKESANRYGEQLRNMDVAPDSDLWWNPCKPEQGTLWGSWLELGEKFFNAIIGSPVPLDMRALRALKRSPLALDLYALAAYKAFMANKNGGQFIPWEGLLQQLGADYDPKRIDKFKTKAKTTLRKVSTVFPSGLKHEWHRNGLTFLAGTSLPIDVRSEAISKLSR